MDQATREFISGKNILVTGGCGSIGGTIVRELLKLDPKVVRIFSRDEGKHFDMQQELGPSETRIRYLIGDIRDRSRLHTAMRDVDLVFHAAALKHVPLCEYNPFEAVQTNVIGTQNVIMEAAERGVKRMVAISTDKAMTPVNTMGASKLLAEKLVAAASQWNPMTRLACVRFGNVMGSRGSVVPTMIRSILDKREIFVTDPAMTRFMMTIQQAVHLTFKASAEAHGGEIFIFKMPVLKLGDLVDVIVEDTCKRADIAVSDVKRHVVGFRPGEKLHEGLFSEEETTRTEEREDMFVVHTLDEYISVNKRQGWGPVNTDLLLSDKAPLMSHDEIRQMMADAGVWEKIRI